MDNDNSAIIEVAVAEHRWTSTVTGLEEFCQSIVLFTLKTVSRAPTGAIEVSVLLSNDAEIKDLNARYRGQNKATNVLSFPGYDLGDPIVPGMILGDIAVAYETVLRESEDQAKSIPTHLAHLLIHGTLHLLGFDHETDDEADIMEKIEVQIMTELGHADPYAVPDTDCDEVF